MRRLDAKPGSTATPEHPALPLHDRRRRDRRGCGRAPSAVTEPDRPAPARVNSIPPPGVKARSHGRCRPDSTVDTVSVGAGPATAAGGCPPRCDAAASEREGDERTSGRAMSGRMGDAHADLLGPPRQGTSGSAGVGDAPGVDDDAAVLAAGLEDGGAVAVVPRLHGEATRRASPATRTGRPCP